MKYWGILFLVILNQAEAVQISFEPNKKIPLAYVYVVLKAGSVHDPPDKVGLTSLTSQIMLRGTKSKTKSQIDLALDRMGGSFSTNTRGEFTVFRGAVIEPQIDQFLKLMAEVLTEPSFPLGQINRYRARVISSIQASLEDDRTVIYRHFRRFLFGKHPYSRPSGGTIKGLKNITRADLKRQYRRVFRSSNLDVIGTGLVDRQKIEKWAHKLAIARPGEQPLPSAAPPTPLAKQKIVIVDKPDRTQAQILVGQVGVTYGHPDYFKLYLGNYAFGGWSSTFSWLTREIRVKRGWSYGVGSQFTHSRNAHSWTLLLSPALNYAPQALKLALNLVQKVKSKGITDKEFRLAKRSLINNAGFNVNTPKKRLSNRLVERLYELESGFFNTFPERLDELHRGDINRALQKFLVPQQALVMVLGPAESLRPRIAKALNYKEEDISVVNYKDEAP